MGKIKIVSASAGSGKTYKLCELMTDAIKAKDARPEAVLATTFTRKAAAELQERVRQALLKAGMTRQAQTLTFARIGTVNSVCGRLVSDFAFELGLSPELRVIEPEEAKEKLAQALSQTMTSAQAAELAELRSRFDAISDSWDEDLVQLVDKARSNGLDGKGLATSAKKSVDSFFGLLDPVMKDGELEGQMQELLDSIKETSLANSGKTWARDALAIIRKFEQGLGRGRVRWSDWVRLNGLIRKSTKIKEDATVLAALAADHLGHPLFHQDMRRRIELTFELAAQVMEAYEAMKAEQGLMDFVDQERQTLDLLDMPRVQDQLKAELDLVLVDEFQDTSPIQLAIFLKLSELAKTSHWVGDQKQSIYAFRDTDPALMDAAIDGILSGGQPDILKESWRSRPGLVEACSDLFAPAFTTQGLSENRVRLTPARKELAGLGPILERWATAGSNKGMRSRELASRLRIMLREESLLVRTNDGLRTRPMKDGDVAVLCHSNTDCSEVAAALLAEGLHPALSKDGLLSSLEGRSMLAGLRLWLDGGDRLAAAELSLIFRGAGAEEAWLQEAVEAAGQPLATPERDAIDRARQAHPGAGPLGVFDLVVAALELREKCLAWGGATQRLANLDVLRASVRAYVDRQRQGAAEATAGGLLAHWWGLEGSGRKKGKDLVATLGGEDAIDVITWHGSKGLEWPVVVVDGLYKGPWGPPGSSGVHVMQRQGGFDLKRPLADRWIRYWPWPYHENQPAAPLFDRMNQSDVGKAHTKRANQEKLRLHYVTFTRARDTLIFPGKPGELLGEKAQVLCDQNGELLLRDLPNDAPEDALVDMDWAGGTLKVFHRRLAAGEERVIERVAGTAPVAPGPRDYPPAWLQASLMGGEGDWAAEERIGEAFQVHRIDEDLAQKNLGSAVHGFFAADDPERPEAERLGLAEGLLKRWKVEGMVEPKALVESADRLRAWVDARWPDTDWRPELALLHRHDSGSTLRGDCDLLIRFPDGYALVDHKILGGDEDKIRVKARGYLPQLEAYAAAVDAASEVKVRHLVLHLPLSGVIFEAQRNT